MIRFFGICLVLAVGSIAAVVLAGNWISPITKERVLHQRGSDPDPDKKPEADPSRPVPVESERSGSDDDRQVRKEILNARPAALQALILPDGRVMPADRVDMPSDRDGSLLMLATPAQPGEFVPADKLIIRTVTFLGVAIEAGEKITQDELILDPAQPGKQFRRPRATDTFGPNTTTIVSMPIHFRKLAEDDQVEEGQMVGLVRPDLAVADLTGKQAKVLAAKADWEAAISTRDEMSRQYDVLRGLIRKNSATLDDLYKAKVQYERYKSEAIAKDAGIIVAQREMAASWTTLNLHILRAPIAGTIRSLYKQAGESVKNQDSVMLLQNTRRLRVEAQVEVQDAMPLRERLLKARQYRAQANQLAREGKGEAAARQLRALADALVSVEIEASRPQPPVAVLRGHLQEVTCVAVSRGPNWRIVSGSDEGIARIWERIPGEERWEQRARLFHGNLTRPTPVRALACTPAGAKRNLLLTATSTGRVRIFDLDDLKKDEVLMPERHQGTITAVAFNADGTLAATGGEDRSICIWNVLGQKRLLRKAGAHQSAITSLAFTPAGQLVSAGRDKGLFVWKIEDGNGNDKVLTEVDRLQGRSGDVAQLGLDPTGKFTLSDEGRELRVVALDGHGIEGSISNSGASGSFSTFALFSPSGKAVLTNGNAPGRLQLWRAPSSKTRAAELRQFLWTNGIVTCAAFEQEGGYAVTGTTDQKVLVWKMPSVIEATRPVRGELTYVEGFLDTSLKRVTVRAMLDNSQGWVIPGSAASIIVPPAAQK